MRLIGLRKARCVDLWFISACTLTRIPPGMVDTRNKTRIQHPAHRKHPKSLGYVPNVSGEHTLTISKEFCRDRMRFLPIMSRGNSHTYVRRNWAHSPRIERTRKYRGASRHKTERGQESKTHWSQAKEPSGHDRLLENRHRSCGHRGSCSCDRQSGNSLESRSRSRRV